MRQKSRIKLNRVLRGFLLFVIVASLAAPAPAKADTSLWPVGPDAQVKSAVVIEADTGTVLYRKDAYTAYQPANLTQLMTALVVTERCSLMDIMTMSTKAETATKGSRVGLVRKESVTVESALYAVLLASGNEVAYGLSELVSGESENFVALMNKKAEALGLTNTHFNSPEGSDHEKNYACAADIAIIAKEFFKNSELAKIAGTGKYTIPATNLKEARPITNRHLMIKGDVKYEHAVAGKVAYSEAAGHSGVTLCKKDGMNIICVVMGASTKDLLYSETKRICNWCFENYTAYDISENELADRSAFATMFDRSGRFNTGSQESIITFEGSNSVVVPKGVKFSEITRKVTFNELNEYYHGENVVGTVNYEYGGIFVGSADIIYYNDGYPLNNEVIEKNWPSYLFSIDSVFTAEHEEYLNDHIKEPEVTPTPDVTPTQAPTPTMTEQQRSTVAISSFRRKVIIGSGIAVAVVLTGLYFVVFELPHIKERMD